MAEAERDYSFLKLTIFSVIAIIAALFFGYTAQIFSVDSSSANSNFFSIATILWVLIVFLQCLFVSDTRIASSVFLLEVIALLVPFFGKITKPLLIGASLLYFFLLVGYFRGRAEIKNSLQIRFFRIGQRVVSAVMTGLAFIVALEIVSILITSGFSLPKQVFNILLFGSEPVVQRFIPGFGLDKSSDDVLRSFVASRAPTGASADVIAGLTKEVKTQLENVIGGPVLTSETVRDLLYRISVKNLNRLHGSFKEIVIALSGLLVFSLLKGILFFVGWFVVLLTFAAYQLLLAFNFVYIAYEPINKEVIMLK